MTPNLFSNISIDYLWLISNLSDLFHYLFVREPQIPQFILNSTNFLNNLITWLNILLSEFNKDSINRSILIHCLKKLIDIFLLCLVLNEDLVIQILHKQNKMKGNTINIYQSLSQVLHQTNDKGITESILEVLAILTPKWKISQELLESINEKETVVEALILQIYAVYKEEKKVEREKKEENEKICNLLWRSLGSLVVSSVWGKDAFVVSGFLNDILKDFNSLVDGIIMEESNSNSSILINFL